LIQADVEGLFASLGLESFLPKLSVPVNRLAREMGLEEVLKAEGAEDETSANGNKRGRNPRRPEERPAMGAVAMGAPRWQLDKASISNQRRKRGLKRPATWTDFETVLNAYRNGGGFDGIGYALAGSGYTGIDFDDCIKADGQVDSATVDAITEIDSYTERSPSGTGFKTLVRGKLPGTGHHKKFGDIELGVFDSGRYFCITGKREESVSAKIEDRQDQLNALVRRYWPNDFKPNKNPSRHFNAHRFIRAANHRESTFRQRRRQIPPVVERRHIRIR